MLIVSVRRLSEGDACEYVVIVSALAVIMLQDSANCKRAEVIRMETSATMFQLRLVRKQLWKVPK